MASAPQVRADFPRVIRPVSKRGGGRLTASKMATYASTPDGFDHADIQPLIDFIGRFDRRKPVAFDSETSYDPTVKAILISQQCIRFVQLSQPRSDFEPLTAIVRVTSDNQGEIAGLLSSLFDDPKIEWIMHNAGFDLWCLHYLLGVTIHPKALVHDTLVMSQLLYLGYSGACFRHDLGTCIRRELGMEHDKTEQTADWRLPVSEAQLAYMRRDVELLYPLCAVLRAKFRNLGDKRFEHMLFELKFAAVCRKMTRTGCKVDLPGIEKLIEETEAELAPLLEEIEKSAALVATYESETEMAKLTAELRALEAKPKNKRTAKSIELRKRKIQEQLETKFKPGSVQCKRKLLATYADKLRKVLLPAGIAINTELDSVSYDASGDIIFDEDALVTIGANENQAAKTLRELLESTSAPTLKRIVELLNLPEKDPLRLILAWSKLLKRVSTLRAYFDLALKSPTGDTRLHSIFGSLAAATGRPSSREPNTQNVERSAAMRSLFPTSEGHVLFVSDFSQAEMRIAAELAEEENLIKAFAAKRDVHTTTAILIWRTEIEDILGELRTAGDIYEDVAPLFADGVELSEAQVIAQKGIKPFRQLAKSANFGLLYGAGWKGLAAYVFNSSGKTLSEEEARTLREKFFNAYPGLRNWHRQLQQLCDSGVRELPIADGRLVRHIPDIITSSGEMFSPARKVTVAANTPVQGMAAVILKAALIALQEAIDDGRITARLVNQVHDEIVVEIPIEITVDYQEMASKIRQTIFDATQGFLSRVAFLSGGGLCLETGTWADK